LYAKNIKIDNNNEFLYNISKPILHNVSKLKFMDFCSGIGGGRLGLIKSGFESVGFVEIDNIVVKSYELMYDTKNEQKYCDLTKIDIQMLPYFDCLIAGFPCQTFSIIGQRQGMNDCRGLIINSLVKILKEKSIKYFILENVKGLINHNNGHTLITILELLSMAGYKVEYKVLNSINYGVPQMRERIYFVGIRKDLCRQGKIFDWEHKQNSASLSKFLIDTENEITDLQVCTLKKYLQNKYNNGKFELSNLTKQEYTVIDTRQSDLRIYKDKVPTIRKGRQGILYVRDGKLRNLTGLEGLLLQGFGMEYAFKLKGKVPNSVLLGQVGNAMTVPVIQSIANSLLEYIGDVNENTCRNDKFGF